MKHRLVGAAVLIAIGIIAWPIIFDTSMVRDISQRSEVAPRPDFERFDVDEPQRVAVVPDTDYEQQRQAQVARTQAGRDDSELLPEDSAAALVPSPDAAARDENGLPIMWAAQLGLFNQAENAHQMQERARAAGFHVLLQKTSTPDGAVYRVFSEPKLERSAADGLRDEINSTLGLKSFVTRYYP